MKRIEFLAILLLCGCGSQDPQPKIVQQGLSKPEFWTDNTVKIMEPKLDSKFEKKSNIKIEIELKELSHHSWPDTVVANLEGKVKSSKKNFIFDSKVLKKIGESRDKAMIYGGEIIYPDTNSELSLVIEIQQTFYKQSDTDASELQKSSYEIFRLKPFLLKLKK